MNKYFLMIIVFLECLLDISFNPVGLKLLLKNVNEKTSFTTKSSSLHLQFVLKHNVVLI